MAGQSIGREKRPPSDAATEPSAQPQVRRILHLCAIAVLICAAIAVVGYGLMLMLGKLLD